MNQPELAKAIRVERQGNRARVFVDGEEFPWFIERGSINVFVRTDEAPSVSLTLLAERVEIVDDWNGEWLPSPTTST